MSGTITLTYGDQAENHVGMQQIGQLSENGFSYEDLLEAKQKWEIEGYETELIDLKEYLPEEYYEYNNTNAYILVVRNGVSSMVDKDLLFSEQIILPFDKKAKMRGRVVNKRARRNLCYGPISQEANYEEGKGTIIAFSQVPQTNSIRTQLSNYINTGDLVIESNYYYNTNKCYIGFHGDTERRKVIGVRLGETLPLYYQWYFRSQRVGELVKIDLNHGDLYNVRESSRL